MTAFLVAPLLALLNQNAPIPDANQMKHRVLKSLRRSEEALENYSCIVREQSDELDSDGSVKKHRSAVKEQFFVNGIQIDHTLDRDGTPLGESAARKEQERVDKEVKKYSDLKEAEKARSRDEKQADMFLRALQLKNGRREVANGIAVDARPTAIAASVLSGRPLWVSAPSASSTLVKVSNDVSRPVSSNSLLSCAGMQARAS